MAADISRESSFMQYLSNIKECDVEIKIIYCLDDESTVNHFIGGRRCRLAVSQTLHFRRRKRIFKGNKKKLDLKTRRKRILELYKYLR